MEKIKRTIKQYVSLDAWQRWEYKHTTGLLVALVVFIFLLDTSFMATVFDFLSRLSYVGVFLAGVMFVSVFTAVPAVVLLLSFSDLNPFVVAMIAALGSMIGDYLILKYAEDRVAYELKPLAFKFGIPQTIAYLQGQKPTLGLVRLIGALIIASPLPDELGIAFLGIGRLNKLNFMLVCYLLNAGGILAIVLSAKAL